MALSELKQAQALLQRAAQVLLIVPEKASADALASMIAFYLVLQTDKPQGVDEVSPQHVLPALQFLPGSSQVMMAPRQHTEVIIDLAGPTTIAGVRVEPLQGGVRVHLALPDRVTTTKDQLETSIRALPYDVVVIFGAADVEELGDIFTRHADFFYNTPTLNIDHRAQNEHFGTVNLVDITAGSIAEVVYDLIVSMKGSALEATVATALYAGIVAGTESFQRPSTTPRSFEVAARLMEQRADREAVIQHLVKTKPLSLLKLTGRLYARLRFDEYSQLFWSVLKARDYTDSEASPDDLRAALRELSNNIATFTVAFVVSEHDVHQYETYVLLGKGLRQRRNEIQVQLQAQRENGLLHFSVPALSLEAAEQVALERVRSILP